MRKEDITDKMLSRLFEEGMLIDIDMFRRGDTSFERLRQNMSPEFCFMAKITKDGRITIPTEFREIHKIGEGHIVQLMLMFVPNRYEMDSNENMPNEIYIQKQKEILQKYRKSTLFLKIGIWGYFIEKESIDSIIEYERMVILGEKLDIPRKDVDDILNKLEKRKIIEIVSTKPRKYRILRRGAEG